MGFGGTYVGAEEVSTEIADTDNIYYGNSLYEFGDVGDELVLEAIVYNQNFAKVDVEAEGLMIYWYKISSNDEYEDIGWGTSITIPSLTEDDIGSSYYYIVSKDGETSLTEGVYYILGIEECVRIEEPVYYASVGDSLTMTIEPKDYYGNPSDVEDSNCYIAWGKRNGGEVEFLSEGTSCVIDSVQESDFDNDGASTYVYAFVKGNVAIQGFVHIYESIMEPEIPTEESTTEPEVETTAKAEVETATKAPETTMVAPTTAEQEVKKPAKAKIKKTYAKKKASKIAKIKIKKVKDAKGYQVQISKSKKFKSKNILIKKHTTKLKPSIKSKKLKNKKKLYVRVRAYVLNSKGEKVYGKWSKVKKITIK